MPYLASLYMCSIISAALTASELHVPSQYPDIASAIAAAADSDTIILAPGTYAGPENCSNQVYKSLTIQSINPTNPLIVNSTVIDCSNSTNLAAFSVSGTDAQNPELTLMGLTIVNSSQDYSEVVSSSNSEVSFHYCVFKNNSCSYRPCIFSLDSDIYILTCRFLNNSSDYDSVISTTRSKLVIQDSIFSNSQGDHAVIDVNSGSLFVTRCSFTHNNHPIRSEGSQIEIQHCDFQQNFGEPVSLSDSRAIIQYCRFTQTQSGILDNAAAILAANGSYTEICYNDITENWSNACPIYCTENSTAVIQNNRIYNNTCIWSPITVWGASAQICNNVICSNMSYNGAVGSFYGARVDLRNNTIAYNWAVQDRSAGAVTCTQAAVSITDCILFGNFVAPFQTPLQSPLPLQVAVFTDPWFPIYTLEAQVSYSLLQGGRSGIVSDANVTYGPGNLDSDPRFVRPGRFNPDYQAIYPYTDFWIDWDLHLLAYSPCINKASDLIDPPMFHDFDDNPRPFYGRNDIGAFEVFPIAGDTDFDEQIDSDDLAYLAQNWLEQTQANYYPIGCDFDGTGRVDLRDFALLAANWLINSF